MHNVEVSKARLHTLKSIECKSPNKSPTTMMMMAIMKIKLGRRNKKYNTSFDAFPPYSTSSPLLLFQTY